MAEAIEPVVTSGGLSAALSAEQNGLKLEITHIALGSGQWTPTAAATGLLQEEQRVPIAASQIVADPDGAAPDQLTISALIDGPQAYWINEFSIIASGSVVLALWSHPSQPLAYKAAAVQTVFTHDLILRAFPPGAITVANINTDLNLTVADDMAGIVTAQIRINIREIRDALRLASLESRLATLEAALA